MPVTQNIQAVLSDSAPSGPPPYGGSSFYFNGVQTRYTAGINMPGLTSYLFPNGSYGYVDVYNSTEALFTSNLGPLNEVWIDMWFYPENNDCWMMAENAVQDENSGYRCTILEIDSSNYLKARFWGGNPITCASPVIINAWNHVYMYAASGSMGAELLNNLSKKTQRYFFVFY